MELEQLDRLEEKIGELLEKYEALSKKNAELFEIIAKKDEDLARHQARVTEMIKEKENVSRRVGDLLSRFESIKPY